MAPELITLHPRSAAERCGLTSLLDLGELLAEAPIQLEDTRVIGGHMIAIHVARHQLGQDFGRLSCVADSPAL